MYTNYTGTPIYKDGNIAQAIWRVRGRERQTYSYTYDGLQSITNAAYSTISDANAVSASGHYTNSYTYNDLRGNIKTLKRNGLYLNGNCYSTGLPDDMTYNYTAGTNKLSSITEPATSNPYGGFRSNTAAMTYDNNGNMISHSAKGINAITYNHLNLPVTIAITGNKTIDITYAADGTKLRKVVKTNDTIGTVQEYLNGIEYIGNSVPASNIEAIYHAEGRVTLGASPALNITTPITSTTTYNGSTIVASSSISSTATVAFNATQSVEMIPGFVATPSGSATVSGAIVTNTTALYEYAIKDHLGNTRLMYADLNNDGLISVPTEILQENHYDPFGYGMDGPYMNHVNKDNQYQYNGKELNNDHGLGMYDYGARWYDPSIARWSQVDPLSEKFESFTPFNYVLNNPIILLDPDGMDVWSSIYQLQSQVNDRNESEVRSKEADQWVNASRVGNDELQNTNQTSDCNCDCPGKPPCESIFCPFLWKLSRYGI